MKLVSSFVRWLLLALGVASVGLGAPASFAQQAPAKIADAIVDDDPVVDKAQPASEDLLDRDFAQEQARGEPRAANDDDLSQVRTARSQGPQTGDSFYCDQRRLGRWFYCDKPSVEEDKPAVPQSAALSASDRVKAITRKLDELRDRAILDPSEANVSAYIRYQNRQSERASTLADVWERTLIAHPELDYNQQRPISTLGKRAWSDKRNEVLADTMIGLRQRYGIFYFYAGDCQTCEIQGPILTSLRDSYGLTIVGVSEDGYRSPLFPNTLVDAGERQKMGLPGKITPTIALYDTKEHRSILIGSGVISADEIIQRIYLLTRTKPGEDY